MGVPATLTSATCSAPRGLGAEDEGTLCVISAVMDAPLPAQGEICMPTRWIEQATRLEALVRLGRLPHSTRPGSSAPPQFLVENHMCACPGPPNCHPCTACAFTCGLTHRAPAPAAPLALTIHRVLGGAAPRPAAQPASCKNNARRRGEHTASPAAAAAAAETELLTSGSRWRRSRPAAVGEGGGAHLTSWNQLRANQMQVACPAATYWSHVGATKLSPSLAMQPQPQRHAMQPHSMPGCTPARSAPRGGPPCARAPPCSWRAAPPAGPQCSAV